MIDDQIGFQLGQVMVSTTHNKGHDVEFWAAQTTKIIVGISEEADPIFACKQRLSATRFIR